MKADWRMIAMLAASAAALLWAVPFAWMAVASLRPGVPPDIASLTPAGPFSPQNFADAWASGSFPLWYLNTITVCCCILTVQLVTATAAGYAFARLEFPGRGWIFAGFLLQLLLPPALLIAPNLATLSWLHIYDSLVGIMAPYFASAFGVFLMRQTFRTIPRDYEEAAMLEGASIPVLIRHVLVPLARPGLVAFAIVSVSAHWNEFLWPLIATSSPQNQVLTVGLASFASGTEAGSAWGIVAAGTFLVAGPLLLFS
jgi:sn-glycerol 3-phosphate transport system permease protein